jgi:hypothetical protein
MSAMSDNAENGDLPVNSESETRRREDTDRESGDRSPKDNSGDTNKLSESPIRAEVDLILAEVIDEVVARCNEEPSKPEPASCCMWCLKVRDLGVFFLDLCPCFLKIPFQ